MGIIELDKANPGMVLAKPVHSHVGQLISKEGRELTEKDILLFEAWGVKELDIEGVSSSGSDEQALSGELGAEEIAALDTEINAKFSRVQGNEIGDEIKKAIRRIRLEELAESKMQENE
jgi:hypothetical protein